jgi:hypothetical protein
MDNFDWFSANELAPDKVEVTVEAQTRANLQRAESKRFYIGVYGAAPGRNSEFTLSVLESDGSLSTRLA